MAPFIITFARIDIIHCSAADYQRALDILAYDRAWNLIAKARSLRLKAEAAGLC